MERDLDRAWRAERERLASSNQLRELRLAESSLVDFTSNDTLNLARHPALVEGAQAAACEFGAGARASRLLGGGSPLDEAVEAAVARWLDADAALLFPTGYQANLGVTAGLFGLGDFVCSDARNHASLIDGLRLSRARVGVFEHGDADHADRLLADAVGAPRRWLVTEGIFSMDGDAAPLARLAELCVRHDAWLIVDEAHAVGMVGPEGAGAWAATADRGADPSRLAARVVTGGKALGAGGGLVVCSSATRERLVQGARSLIFTTGCPPPTAGALAAAVPLARAATDARARVREHAARIAAAVGGPPPAGAIVPVVLGESEAALAAAAKLRAAGFDLRAVRPPSVPAGSARLRVALHAFNSTEDVEALASALATRPTAGVSPAASGETARALFVVGTDTDIGKTVVAACLARAAANLGAAAYWKPVQTGEDDDTREVERLCAGCDVEFAEPLARFPLPASPHEAAAAAGEAVEPTRLAERLAELTGPETAGALIVELAGGLLVPYDERTTQADWLAAERPPLVLVARSGLGTLNHTLLSVEALAARGLRPLALVLVGKPHASNRATLASRTGLEVLELPLLDPLGPAELADWLAGHELAPLFRDR
ncbi:MAG: dethiobiotin synthase [Planctomycetota bacterium]|nr:dethiobiotin synthase [Planctomycetota bacterium]